MTHLVIALDDLERDVLITAAKSAGIDVVLFARTMLMASAGVLAGIERMRAMGMVSGHAEEVT